MMNKQNNKKLVVILALVLVCLGLGSVVLLQQKTASNKYGIAVEALDAQNATDAAASGDKAQKETNELTNVEPGTDSLVSDEENELDIISPEGKRVEPVTNASENMNDTPVVSTDSKESSSGGVTTGNNVSTSDGKTTGNGVSSPNKTSTGSSVSSSDKISTGGSVSSPDEKQSDDKSSDEKTSDEKNSSIIELPYIPAKESK